MKSLIVFSALLKSDYLPNTDSVEATDIVNYIFGLFGVIAVLVVVYAGIQIIISNGNSEKVATARRSIIYVIVGLIIGISAWTIVSFVVGRV